MSKTTQTTDLSDRLTLESGIEALQSGAEFRGPVEELDGHPCNDHFAQIYETPEERFAAAIPFVRHGLEQGEQVMYVVDESSEAEVRAAFEAAGVDLDETTPGALSFHTVQETYLRNGTFDPDEMIDFYAETVDEATAEYEGLRIVAETSWLQEDATTVEQFMEYESKVNDLFSDTDSLAICQYDRNGFPPEIIRTIVQTHPHLIYEGTVCHNFYYTPPEEFFGPEDPGREVDRMLGTLRERTEVKAALEEQRQFLREQNDVTADPDLTFDEKVHRLLDLGCKRFGMELGAMARVDPDADSFEVEYVSGDHDQFEPGVELPLSETYCVEAIDVEAAASVTDPAEEGYDDILVYEEFGVEAYLGTYLGIDGGHDRTLFFVTSEQREDPFTDDDYASIQLMGQWAKYELERTRQEQFLHESYAITSDPGLSFEEKLEQLLDLGRERFGLDVGYFARTDSEADEFEVLQAVGTHDQIRTGVTGELSETYCQKLLDSDEPLSTTDALSDGWEDDPAYDTYGLDAYLGTELVVDGEQFGTLCFGAGEPRSKPFTDAERTFLDLMNQWITYELERRRRERYLRESYEITSDPDLSFDEKLERLLDLARERFGLDAAGLTHLPEWDGKFLNEYALGYGDDADGPTWTDPGEGCYCRQVITADEPVGMADVRGTDWEDDPIYREHGLASYIGTRVMDGSTPYGTVWVGSTEPRDREFTEAERTFLELIGEWVSYELERRQRERDQHELYETTAAPDLDFDEKVQRILELGRERYDLGFGLLTRTDEETYEVVQASGGGDALGPGVSGPIGDAYCRKVVDDGETVCVTHAVNEGWADDPAYEAQGLECYLGTEVRVGRETYGTLCFGSFEPRDAPVTDAEETFLDLMGQCVSYELEREHHERQLTALNEMGRHLMDAENRADVAEIAVEHAAEPLQLPVAAFVAYDERTGRLSPVAQTPRAEDELPTTTLCDRGSGDLWEAFVSGETRLVEDVADISGAGDEITAVLAVPLGSQGLFVTATTGDEAFPPAERDFVEATAATIEAACTRADRERQLQEREETLEAQNETLERMNRVNDIIRSIDQALVKASSRSEIDEVVCEQLADVGPYELAWIGDHDPVEQRVTPRESAGTAQGYLDDITIQTDESPEGQGPTGTAVRTRESQVVNDVLEDRSFEPWRQDALNRGYHASMALPLVYEDTLYGVLNVYAGEPGVFDGLERAVLDELADNIAYAINAVESKKALMSDEVTELEFSVDDRSLGVVELIRETGCEFSQESLVPREDGRLQSFFSTRGTTEEAVLDVTPRLPITDVDLVSEHEEDGERVCLFEGTLTGDSLAATVLEHGGRIRRIDATDDSATVTVHLAADANVREFTEMLRRSHPSLELTAQRTRERTRRTVSEARAALTEDLTDRQLEALQTAYVSGYFDQPRARTASEIAETMEIAQPTFNSHLRAAHRKLCRQLFDDRPLES